MKNISVPEDVHQRLREAAASVPGETISGLAVKAINAFLNGKKAGK